MDEYILPAKYFGRAVAASDKGSGKVINGSNEYDPTKGTIRSKVEKTVTVSGTDYHLFPGDELPSGATVGTSQQFTDVEVYIVDSTIMCKAIHKDAVPFMSAFTTNTVWWNPRALNENHYLIWGYSEPCYLYNYPFLTIKKK